MYEHMLVLLKYPLVYSIVFSITHKYTALNGWIVYNELERQWDEMVMI
jgi:hypothetical protein